MKRIVLFVITNLAILLVLGLVTSLLGVDRFLAGTGLNASMLLAFAAVVGFGGAIFSLLISKRIAKWSTGAQVIVVPQTEEEAWLLSTVKSLAERAGIGMPEVAIYAGEPNAFATGAFRDSSLVAVSTGLLRAMRREEVEAVLGHEVAHIANGDMVTMTLLQGVLNTFVIFASRALGFVIDMALRREDDDGPGIGYYVIRFVLELVFGLLASLIVAWFSRQREFHADRGAADLLGQPHSMVGALARLSQLEAGELPSNMAAMGIHGGLGRLFATHPPIEERIAALQSR